MDALCQSLTQCTIEFRPKLYDMMIYDFADLSEQYKSHVFSFTFGLKPEFNYVTDAEINELIFYLQNNKVDSILLQMIHEKSPHCTVDTGIIHSMIDYYIECLSQSV